MSHISKIRIFHRFHIKLAILLLTRRLHVLITFTVDSTWVLMKNADIHSIERLILINVSWQIKADSAAGKQYLTV
jgi:hypothetical protein